MGEYQYSFDKYSRHLCYSRPTLLTLSSQYHRSKYLPTASTYDRYNRNDYSSIYGNSTSDIYTKSRTSSLCDRNDKFNATSSPKIDSTTLDDDLYHYKYYKSSSPLTSTASVLTSSHTSSTSYLPPTKAIASVTTSLSPHATSKSTSYLSTRAETSFDRSAYSTKEQSSRGLLFSNIDDEKTKRSSPVINHESSSEDEQSVSETHVKGDGTNGLSNLGNTCFMNSILQCLSHTVKLRDYSLRRGYVGDSNENARLKGKLFRAFAEILRELWSDTNVIVEPSDLKTQIEKFSSRFAGYEYPIKLRAEHALANMQNDENVLGLEYTFAFCRQHDSQEFLRFLLDGLHEEINQMHRNSSQPLADLSHLNPADMAKETWRWYETKDKSYVFDLFVGQLQSSLKCLECERESLTYDPFWDLSLPISSAPSSFIISTSLEDCLETFTKEEILDGENKPYCKHCKGRRKMKKKLLIHRFPQILVIHLKRFKEGRYFRQKLDCLVDFPVRKTLDLQRFATNICDDDTSSFQLYAVSNHSGSSYSGHYTAYCRCFKTKTWHEFNDSRVRSLSEDMICNRNAYVLFYAKKKNSGSSKIGQKFMGASSSFFK